MTAIAQNLLSGPSVTLSKTHLIPQEVAKWIAHQRTQMEARTFDSRTLTTTISERSWAMIELKIDSSRTLRENPSIDWRVHWEMDIFFKALEEVYALDSRGRFLDAPSIWRTITHDLCKTTRVDSSDMDKLSESYVAYILEQRTCCMHSLEQATPGETRTQMRCFTKSSSRHCGRTRCSRLTELSSDSCSYARD